MNIIRKSNLFSHSLLNLIKRNAELSVDSLCVAELLRLVSDDSVQTLVVVGDINGGDKAYKLGVALNCFVKMVKASCKL